MRWRVQKVGGHQFAVSATIDGAMYDLIGHFKSMEEAQQAGRRYVSDVLGKAVVRAGFCDRFDLSLRC